MATDDEMREQINAAFSEAKFVRLAEFPLFALTGPGESVGVAAVIRFEGLDQAAGFKARDGTIERSRTEAQAGHTGDVFDHRVSMLGPIRQADQDEQGRFGEPPEARKTRIAASYRHRSLHVILRFT